MKILGLKLENFRQHISTEIEFLDGMTAIIGSNGSGKSTIIEAAAYCLYGSKAIRGKIDTLKTYGLSGKEQVTAELVFEHSGQNYRVQRTLGNAKIYLGGNSDFLAEGSSSVTDYIISILGMTYEEFIATYWTEQKSLEFLSGQKGTTEREKFITRLMGYDKLQKVQELLREDKRNLKAEVQGLISALGSKEKIEEQIKLEKEALARLKAEEKEAIKILTSAELEEQLTKKDYIENESTFKDFQSLQTKLAENKVRLEEQSKMFSILEKESCLNDEKVSKILQKLDIKINDFDNYYKKYNEELQKLKQDKENRLLTIKSLTQSWQDKLTKVSADFAIVDSQKRELSLKLKTIKKLKAGTDCPTCGQILGEEFKNVQKGIEKQIVLKDKEFLQLENKLNDIKLKPVEIIEHESQVANLKIKEQELLDDQPVINELKNLMSNSSNNQEKITKMKVNLQKIKEEILKSNKELEGIDFSLENFRKLENKYEVVRSLANTARLQKVRVEGKLRESESLLRRSEDSLLEFNQKTLSLKNKQNELILLEESDEVLTNFRKHLNDSIKPRLAEIASEFLTELSDGRYTNVEIADDFSPNIYEDGNLKTVLSGGEEDLLNLCLRLSLSSLIAERAGHSFSLLVLDEVFGSLDENRRDNVLVLLERLQNRFEQIIVITHLDDIKEGVRNLIYVNYDESTGELKVGEQDIANEMAINI